MIGGAGANIAFQVGDDGIVVVDAGSAAAAPRGGCGRDESERRAHSLRDQHERRRGSCRRQRDGGEGGPNAADDLGRSRFRTTSSAGAGVDLGGREGPDPDERADRPDISISVRRWPTETFDYGRKYMYLNGEGIEVLQQPAAHTDGDSIVFFRRSDVVVAGDVIDADRFPVIDIRRGGSLAGELDALNRIVALAIPSVPIVSREAGTIVDPRPRSRLRSVRRRALSRHGHDRSRSRGRPDESRQDARSDQGGGACSGLLGPLRIGFGSVDDEQLHRGDLSEPFGKEIMTRPISRHCLGRVIAGRRGERWPRLRARARRARRARSRRQPRPHVRPRRLISPVIGWRSSPKTGGSA